MKSDLELRRGYERCTRRVLELMQLWISTETEKRLPDLRFHHWGKNCFAGPLTGGCLDVLCASDDARRMCEWIDERTDHQATLLQAYCCAELLGLLPPVPN